jgi:hypothetical protein
MRSTLFAVTLTALSFTYWPATPSAQENHVAKGIISEIGGTSVSVKVAGEMMTFGVDTKTHVEGRGAGTKARQITASGKPGPQLSDVLKVGQSVAVTYRDVAGKPYASMIRTLPGGGNGGAAVQTASDMRSTGTVKAIGGDSITIVGASGGGGSFTQTFVVNSATRVVGKGAGTATAAKGGRVPFADLVAAGDKVSVSYRKVGNALQASDVHVTMKGSGSH